MTFSGFVCAFRPDKSFISSPKPEYDLSSLNLDGVSLTSPELQDAWDLFAYFDRAGDGFIPLADLGSIFFDLDYSESECALVTDWVGANAASMSHVDFGIFVRLFEYIKSTATEAESRRFDVFQKTPDFLVCSEARNRGDAAGLASSTVYEIYASASSSRLYVLLCDGTVQVWGAFGECLMRNIPIVVSASENEENRRDSTLFAIEMLYGASGADRRANSGRSSGSSVMQIHERCGLVTVNTTCMDALIRFHDSQSFFDSFPQSPSQQQAKMPSSKITLTLIHLNCSYAAYATTQRY